MSRPRLMSWVLTAILALAAEGCTSSAGHGKARATERLKLTPGATTTTTTRTTGVTALDGTWELSYTRKEFLAAGADPSEDIPENYGHFTLTFHRGDYVSQPRSRVVRAREPTSCTATN